MEKHELERNLESVADNVKVTDLEAETKLSRLFYLQLYSSVLNAERLNKRRERVRRRKQLLTDTKKKVAKSLGWMDLGRDWSRIVLRLNRSTMPQKRMKLSLRTTSATCARRKRKPALRQEKYGTRI